MKQQSFLPNVRLAHGGDLGKGKRKTARPFSHKHAIHVVLRSSRARGEWSLLSPRNKAIVWMALSKCAELYNVEVYKHSNVGNHLHLLVKTRASKYFIAQKNFQAFLRRLSGEIAFRVMRAKKGQARGKFWDRLAFSRIITWGREFETLKIYVLKNLLESWNVWDRKRDSELRPLGIPATPLGREKVMLRN